MKAISAIGIGVATVVISTAIITSANHILTKKRAFNYARSLVREKGIINLGAGPHRTLLAQTIAASPEVAANLDIVPNGMPHFTQWDIEKGLLPFGDKAFDVAFASHVLEHLDDWEFALSEACRVADHVVVVLPHPLSIGNWLNLEHKQYFSREDIAGIERAFPNVKVLC